MKRIDTKKLVLCAMFAALSAVLSQISIPIGPVPINLTHVSIFMAAGLLGVKYGTISQIVFVMLGAAGVPVFSGMRGGIGVILGATGGFIIGYIGCAALTSFLIERLGLSFTKLVSAMYAGWAITYVFGISWFMLYTKADISSALSKCFFPFLIGDFPKTILSAVLVKRLQATLKLRTRA